MNDELEILAQTNPIDAGALEEAVAIDRTDLLRLLQADGGSPRAAVGHRRTDRPTSRAGFRLVTGAAAAALLALGLIGAGQLSGHDRPESSPAGSPPAVADSSETAPDPSAVVVSVPTEPEVGDAGTETQTTMPPPWPRSGTEVGSGEAEPSSATADGAADPETDRPSDGGFAPATDLLVLHYDHAHFDDGHATMAARELAAAFDLDPLVVSGTAGPESPRPVRPYGAMMTAAWGDAWLDAGLDRPGALATVVDRWLTTLDAGGQVWVAEGGVSDFTAEVVAEIRRRRPGLDTTAQIHVVQHNTDNESLTRADHLRAVQATTDYRRIADGNRPNESADLRQASDRFVAAALAGANADAWAVAFDHHPARDLDFSDTVEVLHILGIGLDSVADPDDFAARFME